MVVFLTIEHRVPRIAKQSNYNITFVCGGLQKGSYENNHPCRIKANKSDFQNKWELTLIKKQFWNINYRDVILVANI